MSLRVALIYDAIYPYVGGGVERRNYAIAATAGDHQQVTLYGLHYWHQDEARLLPGTRYVPVTPVLPLYARNGRRSLLEPFVFAWGLFWALLRSREDVWDIGSFPYVPVPVARLISYLKRRPLVVTWLEYWGDYWYEYLGPLGFLGKLFEKIALWCSPQIISISVFTKRRLVAAGAREDRIVVVPNGVDLKRIAGVATHPSGSDLVYVGRLVAPKQVDLLIKALPYVHQHHPGVTLLVIGDGPERGRLGELAGALGLEEVVRFVGHLSSEEEVYAFLKASRVLVLPSKREGFGTVVIEAWACGIPVVVCREPDNAAVELVDSPLKGRIVAPDPEALARGCLELLRSRTEGARRELISTAAEYDWPSIVASVFSVYERCRARASGVGKESRRKVS